MPVPIVLPAQPVGEPTEYRIATEKLIRRQQPRLLKFPTRRCPFCQALVMPRRTFQVQTDALASLSKDPDD